MYSLKTAPRVMFFFLACMTLFKPGNKFGIYDWLVKSDLTLRIGQAFFLTSLFGFFVFLAIAVLALRHDRHTLQLSRSGFLSVLAGSVFSLSTNLVNFSEEPVFALKRISAISLVLFSIWIYQTSMARLSSLKHIDTVDILRPLEFSISLYLIVSFGLALYDPLTAFSPESQGSRMYALSDHPNFLGIIASIGALLLANNLLSRWQKFSILSDWRKLSKLALLLISLWIIVQSGSRTSLLVFLLGFFILIPIRFSAIFAIPLVLPVLWLNIDSINTTDSGLRILSTENNRIFAWDSMISIFFSNPLFGVGMRSVGYSENSYLWIASSSGLLGLTGLIALLTLTILNKRNFQILAIVIPLYFGALFEGYFLDSFSIPLILFLLPIFSFSWKK